MSKTIRAEKGLGFEYWSARPTKGGRCPGKLTKKFTHHRERRAAVREIAGQLKEAL